jgi:hypothetical protein
MVIKRNRTKHEKSFKERLAEESAHYSDLANKTPHGPQRDLYLRRAQQAETAAHVDEWLRSPGLGLPISKQIGGKVV